MIVKRRGVSEIISTIIIILIVSIAGSLLFTYSSGLFQGQQDKALKENKLSTDQVQERYKLTTVWWNGNDNLLNITVYNYGTLDIEISDIYINGVRVQIYFFGRNEVIISEKYLRVAFTSPVSIVYGETYSFNIVSSNGVKKIANWEA
jgi:archaellum component FlaF (FlaF/FlaG flagellin family)